MTGEGPSEDFLTDLCQQLNAMRLNSTSATMERTLVAVRALDDFCFRGGQWQQVICDIDLYLGAIREELNLPAIALMGD